MFSVFASAVHEQGCSLADRIINNREMFLFENVSTSIGAETFSSCEVRPSSNIKSRSVLRLSSRLVSFRTFRVPLEVG